MSIWIIFIHIKFLALQKILIFLFPPRCLVLFMAATAGTIVFATMDVFSLAEHGRIRSPLLTVFREKMRLFPCGAAV